MVARAIRTAGWMYCAHDPDAKGDQDSFSLKYEDFALYNTEADPYQKLNLIGRPQYKEVIDRLREELKQRIIANGEPAPKIKAINYYL